MIDYQILHNSTLHYEEYKFKRIEAPWTVTKHISAITKPVDRKDYEIIDKHKVLVASGEQSFLYLYLKNFIPKGKYQTITPCFRDEPFDSLHTKYFIKNELIDTLQVDKYSLEKIIEVAFNFFQKYFDKNSLHIVKCNENSYDINYKNKELGSYGIRTCDFLTWIYGTGVAEPRLSNVLNSIKYGIS